MTTMAPSTGPLSTTARQQTLKRECVIRGKGLLLGQDAELVICPAEPDSGIVFERVDLDPPVAIPALAENVVRRPRRTTLRSGEVTIETVEHCLSALSGLRIDNAVLKLRGPELPIGDGSALPFAEPMMEAGLERQDAERRVYKLKEAVSIDEPGATIAALPHDELGMRVVFDLDYRENAHRIGKQAWSYDTGSGDYMKEVAPARTYSLREEAEALWAAGMCRHLTPRDMLVIGEDGPIDNAFRFENEPVRHKVLDLIGDLYLTGCAVSCRVLAHRSGHHMNRRLAQAIRQRMRLDARAVALSEAKALDARAITRLMPHRYPMLLVDRVLEIDQGRRAVGVKNVTINEPFFPGHYPGTPIMPGVLIVEAMAQLAGLMLSQQLEHSGKVAILLSMDDVKLRKAVTPGDQLILEAETIRATSRHATVQCRASVGNKTSAEALIRFMMVDPDFT
ncbi:MAG: UDP-3-O-acyl-N-acetylglucosamine deacetylase [Planctomycetota bacterium]|nr:UDP-3-O-acyl-N-acetylglucosamine deacetylase [Planctomycetota bacterium]MDA1106391.1 UDP-3-O-acyl-N-acetylglucosamine deacetylase [Planctomycetota bacterium]